MIIHSSQDAGDERIANRGSNTARCLLSWVGWSSLIVVGLALFYRQAIWRTFVTDQPGTYIYEFGWPLTYREVWDVRTSLEQPPIEINWIAAIIDLVTSIAVLCSSLYVAGKLSQSGLKFRLGNIFCLVAIVAGLIAMHQLMPDFLLVPQPVTFDSPVVAPSVYVVWMSRSTWVILNVALACTAFAIMQISLWIMRQCLRFVNR
jgi:hypothetical protein